MKRIDLEHIIRAAGSIADDDEIVVVGSQAILAQFPNAPSDLLRSMEADIFPKKKPHLSDLVDGSIGELSPFHMNFGYYAHGTGKETVVLPMEWEKRMISIRNENTRWVTGWCLEIHDLVISKYLAGSERDLEFNASVIENRMANQDILIERTSELHIDQQTKDRVLRRITAAFAGAIKKHEK